MVHSADHAADPATRETSDNRAGEWGAAARMADVTDKPESPDALLRMLLAYSGDSFEDRLRQELAKETFVGGRRVVKQELPRLPEWAGNSVHVVKVTLNGAKPPVWRRLEMPSFAPLGLVHEILQVAFDWSGYHGRRRS
jgi:Plasmid pRiA4b ORF-3-like protein